MLLGDGRNVVGAGDAYGAVSQNAPFQGLVSGNKIIEFAGVFYI